MKILFWCPLISKDIGTVGTVLNTVKSINKFSKKKYELLIANVAKEWNSFRNFFNDNNSKLVDLNTSLNFDKLPKGSVIKSRFTYIIISIFSLINFHKLILKERPDFIFIHLISFTPLFLMNIFNYNTNFILRISGYPKLNFFRKIFWKVSNKKIYKVLCPTHETKKQLIKYNIFDEEKIYVVNEPIIDLEKINQLRKKHLNKNNEFGQYVISIGRLTKQKNHTFLIKCFDKILNSIPDLKLLICGSGEENLNLKRQILKLNREKEIILTGYQKNIEKFLKNSLFFILTSEWEDPGFVIVESMFFNTIVFSSNCKNGPIELIEDLHNGFLYEKNNEDDFIKKFLEIYQFILKKDKLINKIKFNAKQKTKLYGLRNYYNLLEKILIE